jgi:hypothetical protein
VDGTNVYWVDYGSSVVMQKPLAGGSAVTVASGQDYPVGIAIDATSIYFTNSDAPNGGGRGSVVMVPIGGGSPTVLAMDQAGPGAIAVDATSVYWAIYGTSGAVEKIAKP